MLADAQRGGNLFVGESRGKQGEHFGLALGQRTAGGGRRGVIGEERVEQGARPDDESLGEGVDGGPSTITLP